MTENNANENKLVDADGLLDRLFDKETRPSLRWLQYQIKRKAIPFYRVGRLIRFDPALVRQALERDCLVQAKAPRLSRATPQGAAK